jgi:hypothetical protein
MSASSRRAHPAGPASTPPAGLKRLGLVAGRVLIVVGALILAPVLLSAAVSEGRAWFFIGSLLGVGIACLGGGLAFVFHLSRSLRGVPSNPVVFPAPWWFVSAVPVLVAIGEAEILGRTGSGLLFAATIIAGSAMAEAAVLAYLVRQTGPGSTWRRMVLCAAAGATLSIPAVLIVGGVVPGIVVALAATLRDLGAALLRDLVFSRTTQEVGRLFFSDKGLFAVATIAIAAPIAEEFLKPLGVIILGRYVRSPGEAFLLGASCGAGFAIVENLFYESVLHPVWGGIVFIRSIGAALHPMGAGLMALGWYGVFHGHPSAWRRLGVLYLVAMTQHWLWNMASVAFVLSLGPTISSGKFTINIIGIAVEIVLLLYFLGQGAAMLVAMRYVGRLVAPVPAGAPVPLLVPVRLATPRGIALAATASLIILMPLGAAGIQAFLIYLGHP